jgi:hypothetical protein
VNYRQRLLSEIVEKIDRYEECQAAAKKAAKGRLGLQYGCAPHVLDAAKLIREVWDAISPSTIGACWARSGCVRRIECEMEHLRDYRKQVSKTTIDDLIAQIIRLGLNGDQKMISKEEMQKFTQSTDKGKVVEDWLLLEGNTDLIQSETDCLVATIDALSLQPSSSSSHPVPQSSDPSSDANDPSSNFSMNDAVTSARDLFSFTLCMNDSSISSLSRRLYLKLQQKAKRH